MSLWRISGECVAVADPELRFTPGGKAVANLRVVTNDVKRGDNGGWEKGDPCFLSMTVWEKQAEHLAETVHRGDTLVIQGQLSMREYEVDGQKRTSYEVKFGPSDFWGVSGRWSGWTKREDAAAAATPPAGSDPWASQSEAPPW